jgi:Putative transposase/Transposase zinc-binding domain
MVESAEICRLHGPAYRAKFDDRRRPSHRRAMQDLAQCRTEPRGGQVSHGEPCQESHDRSHASTNRHGPQCQQDQAAHWLDDQTRLLLPVPHCLVTLTLPVELRALARRHQNTLYNSLLRSSSAAVQELALAPRCIGGRIGLVGVRHPWTRELCYHPHAHDSVDGGGLSAEGTWRSSRQDFLVPVTPRAVSFRAECRAPRHKTDRFSRVDDSLWNKAWVVHCEPVGTGKEACNYRAPYLLRVALSHHRLLKLAEDQVTLQYKDSATAQGSIGTVPAEACMRRFLQHVLPDRCINVRDDGFLSPGNRHGRTRIQELLGASTVETHTPGQPHEVNDPTNTRDARRCPTGGSRLILVETLRPKSRWPPCSGVDRRSSPHSWRHAKGPCRRQRRFAASCPKKPPHDWRLMIHPATKSRIRSRLHGSSTACDPTAGFVWVNIGTPHADEHHC